MESKLSELLSEFELTEKASEQPISDTHLEEISRTGSQQWRSLPPHLELPDTTVDDIEHDSHKEVERKNNFFFTWKHKKGRHATYRKLLQSLLKIERRDDAEKVCKLLLESVATEHVHQKPSPRTLPGTEPIPPPISDSEEKTDGVSAPVPACPKHNSHLLWYCFDCSKSVCKECHGEDRSSHTPQFTNEAAVAAKKKLVDKLDSFKKEEKDLDHRRDELRNVKFGINVQEESITDQIRSSFGELQKIIDSREQKLLEEIASITKLKAERVSEQENGLNKLHDLVKQVTDRMNRCMLSTSDEVIVSMYSEIENQIGEIEGQLEESKSQEQEEADLGVEVNCAEFKQLLHAKTKIFQLPVDVDIAGVEAKSTQVGKMFEFTVSTVLPDGKPTKKKCALECYLKSLASGKNVKCHINLVNGSKYHLQYLPEVRGRHELSVAVNGQQATRSPFPIFFSIPLKELKQPVRSLTDQLSKPRDIAICPSGEVVVLKQSEIVIFESGKFKERKSVPNYLNPWGIAVDDADGGIYITGKTKIVKFNRDFEPLAVKHESGLVKEESGNRGVAVCGDEVLVCNRSSGTIKIYNKKDLTYKREFGSRGDSEGQFGTHGPYHPSNKALPYEGDYASIHDISIDKQRNIYVSDYRKNCVHVFHNDGKFQHSLGKDEKAFNSPHGIEVFGEPELVYVVDDADRQVSVFTTEGKRVHSFGESSLRREPKRICIDKDGFVYVCDYKDAIVHVF